MLSAKFVRQVFSAAVCVSLGAFAAAAQAQPGAWPSKPVTIVVAYPPGGMTDIVTRSLAKELSAAFNQQFIVDNKPGASGQVATEWLVRQPADGYTLMVTATGYVIAPFTRPKVSYDPRKDLVPVAALVQTPNMIVVNPAVPAKNFTEFMAWAKQQKSVPYGTAGAGGSTHLGGELLRHVTGVPFVHVPYRGAAPAVSDTVANQIQVAMQDSVTVASFIQAGKLRPIAVTSARRSNVFPDVPTLQESGLKDFDVYTWLGLFAPAATSPEILKKLNATVSKVMHSPEMVASLSKQSSEPMTTRDLPQTKAFIEQELSKWSQLVKTTGVKIED